MKNQKLATNGQHECDNCYSVFSASKLKDIQDLEQRLNPGGEVPSGECPKCGALCYPIKAASNPVYLLQNSGLEISVLAGPFSGSTSQIGWWLQESLITCIREKPTEDTFQVLHLNQSGKPSFSSFSGGYMENIRWVASGCLGEAPDTWGNKLFSLLNRKRLIKQTRKA